ncbi:type II toxin-antitoxin system VapB family antitoxin [Ramlibacter sp. WS9]|uniref:type II toxin-antitoxin system VapB family antitoxin n=1 Tax=Ramlibacter sp. WS9 TaxID=1882741 RepID=UPI001142B831|nr:type II toxin-antitoxin system VapB family antitoxin [Ramlibacter sp. WS9]ROZ75085.1 type II toxin-antitoxin system VapB family antitoxin [Ramlibacter sp. WS9]
MRTTVTIEDSLYAKALELADPNMDRSEVFREAMKTFVRVQAAKRLESLGGSEPGMKSVPRRRDARGQPGAR